MKNPKSFSLTFSLTGRYYMLLGSCSLFLKEKLTEILPFPSKLHSLKPTTDVYKEYLLFFAAARSLQSCLTLCDPIDSSPPGSPVPGILQARTLEWVAISFSNA